MSSLSGESREARIAEIEKDVCTPWVLLGRKDVSWLISELRDALTREAALQKDVERLDPESVDMLRDLAASERSSWGECDAILEALRLLGQEYTTARVGETLK